MGEPEMEPCEHSRERHGSDARCLRRHSWATLGNPLHHCRAHSVALLRRATRPRPWPCLALLLIAARLNISACDAVQKRDAGLPLRRNLKEDDSREWHDRLASSLEEPQEYGVELPGQHTHRRKLTDVPWVGRRRWHVLSMKECEAFRRRLLASANSSTGHERWPLGEYRRRSNQCWSHAEWYCFSGVPVKSRPSPRLLNLLHLYKSRVRECRILDGPGDWEGLRKHLKHGTKSACQYVLWSPTEDGLGNQMLSLVSAFVYSLLTFRVLLVEPVVSSISHLFCEPFLRTPSWQFPHIDEFGGKRGFTSGPFIKNYSYILNNAYELNKPPPNVLQFHIHLWSDMQPFFCPETHHWAAEASALVVSSNLYWLPGLYFVPHLRRKLEALFQSRHVFATLAPLILHPSNRVWAQVTSLLLRHTPTSAAAASATDSAQRDDEGAAGAPPVPIRVGLQFRAKFGIPAAEAAKGSVACLRRLPQLLRHDHSWPGTSQRQDAVSGTHLTHQGIPGEGVSWARNRESEARSTSDSGGVRFTLLLASLDREFKKGVVAQLRDAAGGGPQLGDVVSLTSDTGQRFGDLQHNERALVEILSVALSSQVVLVTPRSTFGYTIVGLSSAVPFFITPCEPAMPEPCFLRPTTNVRCKYSRFRVEKGHIRGVKDPILRSCPDAQWLHRHWEKQPTTGVVAIHRDVTY